MARVTFVRKARKANRVAAVGESYYWWKPFRSGKQFSKDRPRPSQLCSGRKSEVMATQEALTDDLDQATDIEAVQAACESAAESFRDQGAEYEEGADNMPENFQDGDQCNSMREMAESLETQAEELENIDFDGPDEFEDDEPEEPVEGDFDEPDEYVDAMDTFNMEWDEWNSAKEDSEQEVRDFMENAAEEAQSASDEIEFMF